MVDVIITTGEDLRKLEKAKDVNVKFASGIITVPETLFVLRDLKNVTFDGSTGPKGRVAFVGGSIQLFDPKNVKFNNISFHLERPNLDPTVYERWWGGIRVLATKTSGFKDLVFENVSFRGHTDELAFTHADSWNGKVGGTTGSNVIFNRCVIGPSIKGRMAGREFHNFNLMVEGVNNVLIEECVFGAANRRSPQLRGKGNLIQNCIISSYGTMAVGLHGGSELDIRNVAFMPNYQTTLNRPYPIKPVEGTRLAFGNKTIKIHIDQVYEVPHPKHPNSRNGYNCWGTWSESNGDNEDRVCHFGGFPNRWEQFLDLNKLYDTCGVQDTFDKNFLNLVKSGSMIWNFDIQPLVKSDYI